MILRILSVLLANLFPSATTPTPVELHGNLTVVNGQIVEKSGYPPQLRGMSLYWSQGKAGRDYFNAQTIGWLTSDWKVNVVRAAMGVEGDWSTVEKGYLTDSATNFNRVVKVVDAAIDQGIYVLIDWHEENATKHLAKAQTFFATMAKKYGDKPNVIFEIYNEPNGHTWSEITTYAQGVIPVIRKYSQNLIVVGTPSYSSDVMSAARAPLTGTTNVAYALHVYASEASHHSRYMKRADSAISTGLPLFVTEWGLTSASGNGAINQAWADEFWNWMEGHGLSSCGWSLSDANESSAALQAGTWDAQGNLIHVVPTTGNWTTSQLTQTGNYFRDKFRALNPIWNHSAVLPRDGLSKNIHIRRDGNGLRIGWGSDHYETFQVVSPSGRILMSGSVKGSSELSLSAPQGLAFLRLTGEHPAQVPLVVP